MASVRIGNRRRADSFTQVGSSRARLARGFYRIAASNQRRSFQPGKPVRMGWLVESLECCGRTKTGWHSSEIMNPCSRSMFPFKYNGDESRTRPLAQTPASYQLPPCPPLFCVDFRAKRLLVSIMDNAGRISLSDWH